MLRTPPPSPVKLRKDLLGEMLSEGRVRDDVVQSAEELLDDNQVNYISFLFSTSETQILFTLWSS